MNHRIAIAAIATAAALVSIPSAAHADRVPVNEGGDTSSCVTYAEFTAVNDAYIHGAVTRGQVRRTFDTDGHRISTDIMDNMASQVYVTHNQEVDVPEHRAVRFYLGCVTDADPYGSDVYVEFNMVTGKMVASLWI